MRNIVEIISKFKDLIADGSGCSEAIGNIALELNIDQEEVRQALNGTVFKKVDESTKNLDSTHDAIVLKENKGNVLIKCWNDGKETWVRKGSYCHKTGLCSKCLENDKKLD